MNPSNPPHEQPLEALGRDLGFRASDSVANPEMAQQSGTDISVLRWTPIYVAALAVALIGGVGLVVLAVL
jgi:membrane protein required for beta-lactamase induction